MTAVLRSPSIGVLILSLLAGWSLLSHPSAPEAASGAAASVVVAAGLVLGAALGRLDPAIPGLAVLAGSVVSSVSGLPESMSGDPLAPPLGYLNANGALLLCGAAGGVVATEDRETAWRLAACGCAVLTAALCWHNGALAASVAAVLLAAWCLTRHVGGSRGWRVAGASLILVPALLPVAWGARWLPWWWPAVEALSDERFHLWQGAWSMMAQNPASGVGPGRFFAESPVADLDLAWAHSYWLQSGAELGVIGLAGLLLLLAWAVAALGRDSMLLGVLLLPATVDYVLHFGGVLAALSVVVGGALGSAGTGKPWLTPPSP